MSEATPLGRLEKRLLDPAVRASATVVAELLDDDFMEFGSSGGIYDKTQVIEGLSQEAAVERTVMDLEVPQLTPDLGLVTYRATRHGEPPVHSLRSSIWRRTGGQWCMLFHQGTPN